MAPLTYTLTARCVAEVIGTFILVFFGCGSVHAAVLMGAHSGLWQVAIVWGVAIMLSIYIIGGVSGSHINPAITLTLAMWGRFSWHGVVPYIISQMAGAIIAAGVLITLFSHPLEQREKDRGVTRGGPGSEITAMCYGEYFPDPGGVSNNKNLHTSSEVESELQEGRNAFAKSTAMFAEVVGTMLLALVVFAVTDPRNEGAPPAGLAPVFIGLTVAVLISVLAPLTQACFNPARDVGPRIVAYFAGWNEIAIPGPRGFLEVYVAAPIIGALLGGGLYERILRPLFYRPGAHGNNA
ncbi:MAG TPA: MIP/aquaporin family protein [Gemmataceae bacterium]|nr:MIP/aquaporin family protein [Gemmataceae bacterium]